MRVLSIDGGGIRGIIPALVLTEIEARTGRQVHELFDLVAGTSTGGVLACALTRPGAAPARELVELYRTEGPRIFHRSAAHRLRSADGLLEEKYDDRALVDALDRYLGDGLLSEATTRTLVTAYDLEARAPHFFKSWRHDLDGPRPQVARATAAAPTYFEPLRLGAMSLVDGGVFATNPAMCAYAESVRLHGLPPSFVLSLGTGSQMRPIHHEQAASWGLVQWVRPVIDVVFDGVSDTVSYQLERLMPDDRVVRLQTDLDLASDALDDASPRNLGLLELQARRLIERESGAIDTACRTLVGSSI
ncbi:MAG: patatin-like phospholipase family protein [Solirubrobacterales bacterium]|nr:patatin-like phospholipase family protein [Solirubrobacterales bacterium]